MLLIRKMTEQDIAAIAAIEKNTFSDAWTEKGIYDTFCQKQAFIMVAEKEQEIVGYCIIYHVLDEGEIARIAVDSTKRRSGIGKELLRQTCSFCAKINVGRLLLDVRSGNTNAQKFYERFGFQVDGVRKNFYENPKEDAFLMSMEIRHNW